MNESREGRRLSALWKDNGNRGIVGGEVAELGETRVAPANFYVSGANITRLHFSSCLGFNSSFSCRLNVLSVQSVLSVLSMSFYLLLNQQYKSQTT